MRPTHQWSCRSGLQRINRRNRDDEEEEEAAHRSHVQATRASCVAFAQKQEAEVGRPACNDLIEPTREIAPRTGSVTVVSAWVTAI